MIFIGPVTIYLYASHSDWSWMYWFDSREVPALALIPVTVGQCVAVLGGWYVGSHLIRLEKAQWHLGSIGIGGVLLLLLWLISWQRLTSYGSFADYAAGTTLGLMEVKLGYVLCVIAVGAVGAGIFVALELVRDSRRVRSRK